MNQSVLPIVKARYYRVLWSIALVALALGAARVGAQASGGQASLQDLLDKAAIEDLFVDYYSQIGTSDHDYSRFFTDEGRLMVNGLVATGSDEIVALYDQAGGGAGPAPARDPDAVPAGRLQMLFSNLRIEIDGDTALATLMWRSIVSDTLTSLPAVTEYGRERTELVKQGGRWLISDREVLSEGGMPEGLLESYPQ